MEYNIFVSSTMKNPLISVVIPMYNVENYIDETLQSVFNQTLEKIEIILVDDGSTDKTVEIVRRLIKGNTNITLVLKQNTGPGMSRNIGLSLATGEYVSFVDADDILPADALECLFKAALEKDILLVTGMSESFNSNRRWMISSHVNEGAYIEGMKDLYHNPGMFYTVGPCNKLFKRELLDGIQFPTDIKVTEDHPFVIEAYLKAGKFYTLEKVIYYYRQREDEENVSLSQVVNTNSLSVVQDILNSLKITNQLWERYESNANKRKSMQINYFNRIMRADLWPAIRKSIKKQNARELSEILKLVSKWLNDMDSDILFKTNSISRMIYFQMLNNYFRISKECRKQYRLMFRNYTKKSNFSFLRFSLTPIMYLGFFVSSIYSRLKR